MPQKLDLFGNTCKTKLGFILEKQWVRPSANTILVNMGVHLSDLANMPLKVRGLSLFDK